MVVLGTAFGDGESWKQEHGQSILPKRNPPEQPEAAGAGRTLHGCA